MTLTLPVAHGVGAIKDLPVPAWLFYYGAALVLVFSFVLLGVLWTKPKLGTAPERRFSRGLERFLTSSALRAALGALSFFVFVVIVLAGLVGDDSPGLNLTPTFVYVVFWLGIPLLSVLLGDVWSVLSPWRAAADGAAFVTERAGVRWTPPLEYPERLGRWPAAILLTSFVALELCYTDPSSPRAIAIATLVYSWITWTGAAAFGRRPWFENGDGFSAYFNLFAQLAAFGRREGRLVLRWPLSALARFEGRPGTVALVSVALGSVAFDGLSRTSWWADQVHTRSDAQVFALNLVGLAAMLAFVGLTYLAAIAAAQALSRRRDLAGAFAGSLVPIAFAYVVAHYFSLFVLQGQVAIQLVSDPFGYGWDVFGTRDFRPNFGIITPKTTWYVQVGALVVGHVLGLLVAHDRALSLFPRTRDALRTQYAMLALMVLYTVGGMWILSRP